MSGRTPYDGEPFYCARCGLGFGELMACEEPDCELESEEKARDRQQQKLKEARAL
jgi:hypothetical protein